jgi:hypothetical protein
MNRMDVYTLKYLGFSVLNAIGLPQAKILTSAYMKRSIENEKQKEKAMLYLDLNYKDVEIMRRIVNSCEFAKSEFTFSHDEIGCPRLKSFIDGDELELLLRKLLEYDDSRAETLADDIVYTEYEKEERVDNHKDNYDK